MLSQAIWWVVGALRFPLQHWRVVKYNKKRQGMQLPQSLRADWLQHLVEFLSFPKVTRLAALGTWKFNNFVSIMQKIIGLTPLCKSSSNLALFSFFAHVFAINILNDVDRSGESLEFWSKSNWAITNLILISLSLLGEIWALWLVNLNLMKLLD